MGAASPALQGRPADHTDRPDGGAERLQPAATPRRTGTATCCRRATCRIPAIRPARSATPPHRRDYTPRRWRRSRCCTPASTATAATATAALTALTWYNNFTPKDGDADAGAHSRILRAPTAVPATPRTTSTGGFGPTNMSAAKHAFVPTVCDTCHEAGSEFLPRGLDAGAAGPAGRSRGERRCAAKDRRLFAVPQHHRLDQQHAAHRPHAESRQPGLRGVPHGDRRHVRELRDARQRSPCCTPASPATAASVTAARRAR